MPKVSVIIPNYNHAPYLEQRIHSVLEQTYQDFEILFLDDASTDNSREVFAQFAGHPKVQAIFNEQNTRSPFKQWNKGIRNATGDYVWIAESDDFADPKLLETLVPILDANLNVGLAYCQSWKVDSQGEIITSFHYWTDDLDEQRWRNNYLNHGLDECKNYLAIKNIIPNASAVLFRRSLFEQAGYAEESMFLCGDWITWIKLLLLTDVAFAAEPLNYFRYHSSSVRSKSQQGGLEIYEKMQVFLFLKGEIELSEEISSLVKSKLIEELFFRIRRGEITSKGILKIYNLSKRIETFIELRLLIQLVAYLSSGVRRKTDSLIHQTQTFINGLKF
ncbi:MAG: glycosyltransferase [Drouetiella hepatica Uher 2000/2452]|jgi:glycosyltransferase involved in cell wall biosynthesis|uniref:Glycosyltransferase n=1 Tax=Drouetiella hepatica Uher 2000/2452 TaxID=904376 RepID=A0A951Q8T0_9CYAN|nr:glycosyltransferase [Drouetiella hepatica Uher 2000/2452]